MLIFCKFCYRHALDQTSPSKKIRHKKKRALATRAIPLATRRRPASLTLSLNWFLPRKPFICNKNFSCYARFTFRSAVLSIYKDVL